MREKTPMPKPRTCRTAHAGARDWPMLAVRVPPDLDRRLQEEVAATGLSRSEITRRALRVALGLEESETR